MTLEISSDLTSLGTEGAGQSSRLLSPPDVTRDGRNPTINVYLVGMWAQLDTGTRRKIFLALKQKVSACIE